MTKERAKTMENVAAKKRFDALGLTRSEERLLGQVTGLRHAERIGRLKRILPRSWGPSFDVMLALNFIGVYATGNAANVVIIVIFPLMFFIFCAVLSRRNSLITKLYQTLEIERERSAPAGADTQLCDLQP